MTLKKILLGISIFISFILISCSHSELAVTEKIDLSKDWEYSIADPLFCEENGIEIDFVPLENRYLGSLEKVVPGKKGSIWLRKVFNVPKSFTENDVAIYLGRITLADRTYLNRTLIGHEGFFPPHEFTAWNTARFYEIPESLLYYYNENELLIEVYVDGEGSIVSNPFIGDYQAAKFAASSEQFWNSKINIIFAFLMLVLAIYHLVIWSLKKDEWENFWFGLINLITSLYMSVFYLSEIPGLPSGNIPFLWYQKIFSSSMIFLLPFLIQSFINSFFSRHDLKWIRIVRIAFVIVPIVICLVVKDYIVLRQIRDFVNPLIIPPILYSIYSIIYSCIKRKKDSIPLLLGFSPMIITIVLDIILHDLLKLYSLPYFSSMGWQLVIISLLFVLARRFVISRVESQYLTEHLQDEVKSRTKELTSVNNQLTEMNETLEQSRLSAERDMKLAVNVQQSFFPRKAPKLDDWEIAYIFKPMSGVSGDLYDFFTTGKTLNGIGLFDVSGHGIASGLVTMLSKTIIANNFTNDENVNICTIMKNINEEIVKEKGDIENYLTGLLVRTFDNRVQYVSAGHPAVFLRTAKNGKSFPVTLKNNGSTNIPGSGAIVGIPGMDLDIHGIQFTMNPGDALIMYTDCLSESKNVYGEEYGQESVSKSFAASTSVTAKGKLDDILWDFEKFTAGAEIKDDLTVIILQKK